MVDAINEKAMSVGWCHALVFEGPRPSWDEVLAFIHDQGDAPSNLVSHDIYKNRLSNEAIARSARLWIADYVQTPSRIKLGTGAPPQGQSGPLATDTDCWTPDNTTARVCDLKTTFLTTFSEFGITYDTGELNGTSYTEALLYDEDGIAWAHAIITLTKASTQTAAIVWKVLHQAV